MIRSERLLQRPWRQVRVQRFDRLSLRRGRAGLPRWQINCCRRVCDAMTRNSNNLLTTELGPAATSRSTLATWKPVTTRSSPLGGDLVVVPGVRDRRDRCTGSELRSALRAPRPPRRQGFSAALRGRELNSASQICQITTMRSDSTWRCSHENMHESNMQRYQ